MLDRLGQSIGSGSTEAVGEGVNPREKEGFVGVDVADACNWTLAEQLSLDRARAVSDRRGQGPAVELGCERFGSDGAQCRDVGVVAGVHDAQSSEPANIAEHEVVAVVEPPHGADVRIVVLAGRR